MIQSRFFVKQKKQGAFTFWNHPNWTPQRKDGMATLTDVHRLLIREKLLDGIEVVNDQTYSDEALQIALDNNLTIMGNSDIHKLIDWDFKVPDGGHRPLTLVFAKERNAESIKDALMNRRTVAVFKNLLIGRNEFLIPLIESAIKVASAKYIGKYNVLGLEVENLSSTEIVLQNQNSFTLHNNNDIITLAGVPILTTILMRVYRKATGKNDRAKKEFYKDIIPFISIVIFSLIALLLLFYLLVILFDSVIPSFE